MTTIALIGTDMTQLKHTSGCVLQSYECQISWSRTDRTDLRPADSSCQALWRAANMNKSQIMTSFLAGHEVCCHTSPVIERQSAPVRNRKTSLPPVSSNLRFAQSWDLSSYLSLTFHIHVSRLHLPLLCLCLKRADNYSYKN